MLLGLISLNKLPPQIKIHLKYYMPIDLHVKIVLLYFFFINTVQYYVEATIIHKWGECKLQSVGFAHAHEYACA